MTQHRRFATTLACGSIAMPQTATATACAKRANKQSNRNTGVEKARRHFSKNILLIESFDAFLFADPDLASCVQRSEKNVRRV